MAKKQKKALTSKQKAEKEECKEKMGIYRKDYTRKNGTPVDSTCIVAEGRNSFKLTDEDKKFIKKNNLDISFALNEVNRISEDRLQQWTMLYEAMNPRRTNYPEDVAFLMFVKDYIKEKK